MYNQNYCKPLEMDLVRQIQINFTGTLEEDDGTKRFFIIEKQQKVIPIFSLDSRILTV